jgi:hypothetical protein
MKNEIIFDKRRDGTHYNTMSGYYKYSQPTYDAHRKMLDDFSAKYPALSEVADTLLYPELGSFDAAHTIAMSAFQKIFNGLENDAPVKEIKCPGAPERKKSRTA